VRRAEALERSELQHALHLSSNTPAARGMFCGGAAPSPEEMVM
jgi:hypothetical protein